MYQQQQQQQWQQEADWLIFAYLCLFLSKDFFPKKKRKGNPQNKTKKKTKMSNQGDWLQVFRDCYVWARWLAGWLVAQSHKWQYVAVLKEATARRSFLTSHRANVALKLPQAYREIR